MEHMIFQRTRTQSLSDVRSLNLWGYHLDDVSILSQLPNVETLSLPLNNISTLAPFASCTNLRSLFLRQNQISSFDEIDHLRDLPHLTTLSLSDNPIARDPHYRAIVLRKLPQLQKLDETPVKAETFPTDDSSGPPPVPRTSAPSGMKPQFNLGAIVQQAPAAVPRPAARQDDAALLTAVLALIPVLSGDSLQIVLDAIQRLGE
jgi:hypothetical protein